MTNITRRNLLQISGGAVALGSTVALCGYAAAQAPDPALQIVAEWNTAEDRLLEMLQGPQRGIPSEERQAQWRDNVLAMVDAGRRLGEIRPTTIVGAAAVLGMVVQTLKPDGISMIHANLGSSMATLKWLQNVHGVIDEPRFRALA